MPDTIDGQLVVGFNPTILRGQDGRSITSTTVDNNGHLILSFPDLPERLRADLAQAEEQS